MPRSCIIRKGPDRKIRSVTTLSGRESELYDALAGIATMANRDYAAKFLKKTYTPDFKKWFGDWTKGTPRNPEATNKIKRKLQKEMPLIAGRVAAYAADLDNPIMVRSVNPGVDKSGLGFSYYSETEGEGDYFIVDASLVSEADLSKEIPEGMDEAEYAASIIESKGTPIVHVVKRDGTDFYAVAPYMMRKNIISIMDEQKGGVTYENGEPRLFFLTEEGKLYEDYGDAIRATKGASVRAGYLRAAAAAPGVEAGPLSSSGTELTDASQFKSTMEISTDSRPVTRNGIINFLIKKGILSGRRVKDPETGEYKFVGEGKSDSRRIFNSQVAFGRLLEMMFPSLVKMDEEGRITIGNFNPERVELRGKNGNRSRVTTRSEVRRMLREGRYRELSRDYRFLDPVIASILFEDASIIGEQNAPESKKEADLRQRSAILSVLEKFGIRVIGMSDYLSKYETKYGHEPSAVALADIANNVIAVAEGATAADLLEETAHFLVEAYADQAEIESVLPEVRSSEEWSTYASRYYEIYGKTLEGRELDEAVEREILGKMLVSRFGSTERGSAGTESWISRLWRNIVSFLRSNLSDQRSRLNEVLDGIRDSALSGDFSKFDVDLFNANPRVLYSSHHESDRAFLDRQTSRLKNALSRFRYLKNEDRTTEAVMSVGLSDLERIGAQLDKATDEMDKNNFLKALGSVISTAEASASYLKAKVDEAFEAQEKAKREGRKIEGGTFSPMERALSDVLESQILPSLNEIRSKIDHDNTLTSSQKKAFRQRIDKAASDISAIKSDMESVFATDQRGFFFNLMDKLGVSEGDKEKVYKFIEAVQRDISIFARWFGILEHSGNTVVNMLGRLISENYSQAMQHTQDDLRDFLRVAQRGNWTVEKCERLIKKDGDGRPTRFLLNPVDMAKFDREIKTAQMKALRDVVPADSELGRMTDKDILEYVKSGKVRTFDIGRGRRARIKPSSDYFSVSFLSMAEENEYSKKMLEWEIENNESPFSESYLKREEEIRREAERRLGRGIHPETLSFLQNLARQRYVLKSNPAFWEDPKNKKGFRPDVFASSHAKAQLTRIDKMAREATSEYIYVGGERFEKEGVEKEMAEEMRTINEVRRERFNKENKTGRLTRETLDLVRKIQREKGAKAAMDFVLYGGYLNFSDKFYEDAGLVYTKDGGDAGYKGLVEAIKGKKPEDGNTAEGILKGIEEKRKIIRDIIRFNRDQRNPGEVEVGNMSEPELEAIKKLSEEIERDARKLKALAKKNKIDPTKYFSFDSDVADSSPTEAFFRDAADNGSAEWDFATRHMTRIKAGLVKGFYMKMKDAKASTKWSELEKDMIEEEWGISKMNPDEAAYAQEVVEYIEQNYPDNREMAAESITDSFARRFLLPYYRKTAPVGFSGFMARVNAMTMPGGQTLDVAQFLEDLVQGRASQDYGFEFDYLRYDPSLEWMEEAETKGDMQNPNYVTGYGVHHPKMSKYRDEEYFRYFGIDKEGNATLHKDEFEMLQMMKGLNERAFSQYGVTNRCVYSIPQISKDMPERAKMIFEGNGASVVENWFRDTFTDVVDESIYGNTDNNEQPVEEERPKMIPRYYLNELESANDVAHDLVSSFSHLVAQANLYAEKKDTYGYVMGLEQMLLRQRFEGGRKPESTKAYGLFKSFLDDHWHGIRTNMKRTTINIFGYDIDVTKLVNAIERFGSSMDIGFSLPVAITGAFTGNINMIIEGLVGQYIDRGSLNYASKEFRRLSPSYISEIGDIDRTNKMYVLGERMGAFSFRNRVYGAGFSKAVRIGTRDVMYKLIESLTYNLHPTLLIAVMDGARLYNGKFMTKAQLQDELRKEGKEGQLPSVWESLRKNSLWNSVTVEDGQIKPVEGVTMEQVKQGMDMQRNKLRSLMNIVDGSLNEEQRTAAARNYVMRLMTTHRGWLPLAGQRIFKRHQYNFMTNQMEEGYTVSLMNLIRNVRHLGSERGYSNFVKLITDAYKEADAEGKLNLMRMMIYSGFWGVGIAMIYALMGWSDDDKDDWIAQFATYIGLRTINEVSSNVPLFYMFGMADIINDPFPMGRKLLDLVTFSNYSLDKVETGVYEGETKLWRLLAKQTFLKQLYSNRTAEDVRQTMQWWLQTNTPVMWWYGAWRRNDDE